MPSRTTIYCPLCQTNNVYNKLKLHQISLTTAVYLCEDKNCPYPKGYNWIEVKRSLDELLYEKQHSTGDSDLDNWLDEAFEREMSNVNIACKNVTSECNSDNFLAEIFKDLENSMNHVISNENEHVRFPYLKSIPSVTSHSIVKPEQNMGSSCNSLENMFDFECENFVINSQ